MAAPVMVAVGSLLGVLAGVAGVLVAGRWTDRPPALPEFVASALAGAVVGGALATEHRLGPSFWRFLVLLLMLVPATVVDLHCRIIPNQLNLAGAGAGLLLAVALPPLTWQSALVGALVGGGLLMLVHLVYPRGMGMGDVKMAGVLGLFLGWPSIAVALFLAFLLAALIGISLLVTRLLRRKDYIPFGPFLALGAVLAALWGPAIVRWYWRV